MGLLAGYRGANRPVGLLAGYRGANRPGSPLVGIEPTAFRLEGGRAIQLRQRGTQTK